MSGILYGIGVGPGDPEQMTLKALRCIKESDVILLPAKSKENCYAYQIVKQVYAELDEKELVWQDFPMIRDKEKLEEAHNRIYEEIAESLRLGKNVAFLTIGDPTVYSTYAYIHKRAMENDYKTQIVSGVPSFCAACAELGISLAENKEEIHIIPGSYEIMDALELPGTKVFMKTGKQLAKVKKILEDREKSGQVSVYAVSNCGMENQKLCYKLDEIEEDSGYLTIVIVKEK